jgi:hypothetical protein
MRAQDVQPSNLLAKSIFAKKTQIIDAWLGRIWEEVPAAKNQSVEFLRGQLPVFLENIAHSLTQPPKSWQFCLHYFPSGFRMLFASGIHLAYI